MIAEADEGMRLMAGGTPVFKVDALADSGQDLHDVIRRLFGRPHWKRETD